MNTLYGLFSFRFIAFHLVSYVLRSFHKDTCVIKIYVLLRPVHTGCVTRRCTCTFHCIVIYWTDVTCMRANVFKRFTVSHTAATSMRTHPCTLAFNRTFVYFTQFITAITFQAWKTLYILSASCHWLSTYHHIRSDLFSRVASFFLTVIFFHIVCEENSYYPKTFKFSRCRPSLYENIWFQTSILYKAFLNCLINFVKYTQL